jgi:hypothetical protein
LENYAARQVLAVTAFAIPQDDLVLAGVVRQHG